MLEKIKFKLLTVFIILSVFSVAVLTTVSFGKNESKNLEYNIDASIDGAYLSGELNLLYKNKNNFDVNELYFCLYPNAFKSEENINNTTLSDKFNEAYPNGFSEGFINIKEVFLNGKNAKYTLEENEQILKIETGKLKKNKEKQIKIVFEEKLPESSCRFGYGSDTYNFGNWYPILCPYQDGKAVKCIYTANGDPFYSECADYNVSLTLPPEYRIATSGVIVKKENTDPLNTKWTISEKNIRDFAFIISQKYKLKSAKVDDTIVYSYYLKNDKAGENALNYAVNALKSFNEMFGKYPYSTLSVAEANFYIGGMEYPNLVFVSDELYTDSATEALEEVVVHEVAHQWWYGLIGNNEIDEPWLDEGLTQYSVALYYEDIYGKERYKSYLNESESYCKVVFEILKRTMGVDSKKINRKSYEFEHWLLYDVLSYDVASLMLSELRNVIGDEAFFCGIRNYFEDNKFKNTTKELLIKGFNKATKKNISGIIEPWLDGRIYWG